MIIVPQRPPAGERLATWRSVSDEIQSLPGSKAITDEDIQQEIDDYRAGR